MCMNACCKAQIILIPRSASCIDVSVAGMAMIAPDQPVGMRQTPRRRRQTMIINIEWGAFTSSTLPKLDFDQDLDTASANPGAMQLEKLTSGRSSTGLDVLTLTKQS